MPVPLLLRADFDASQLRAAAQRTKDGPQARRLLALASIYDGASRTEAATIGGVTLQIVRDWVVKLNAHGPEGLLDRKAPGQPSRLTDGHHQLGGWPACEMGLSQVGGRDDNVRCSQLRRLPLPG